MDLFHPVENIVPKTTAALALKGSLNWSDTALNDEHSAPYIPIYSIREKAKDKWVSQQVVQIAHIQRKQEPAWHNGIVLPCCQETSSKTTSALALKESLTWGNTDLDPEDVDSCQAPTQFA